MSLGEGFGVGFRWVVGGGFSCGNEGKEEGVRAGPWQNGFSADFYF